MSEGGSRRAVAEIRFGEDRSSITKVAGRSIHQFWSLLSPHFRDVLLAPQRRSDDGGVAWTWREGMEKKPLTAAELAGVRKRLERATESFAENPVNPLMGDDRSGTSSQALIDQVAARVKAMAESLSAKPDAALSDFVCRTETGIMVHSWGVASPAPVIYPESMETGLSGVVLAGGKRLEGYEVVVENAQGLSVARTRSEKSGDFHFTKIGPGRYRVRVVSGRVKFPVKGVMVTVERGAVARLEMRSAADSTTEDEPKENEAGSASDKEDPSSTGSTPPHERGGRRWFGKIAGLIVLLLLLGGGGVWAWRIGWSTNDETDPRITTVRSSSMAPEDFSAGKDRAGTASFAEPTAGTGLGASVDGVGSSAQRPVLPPVAAVDRPVDVAASVRGRAPSTIGSRVDVQSGVEKAKGTTDPKSGAPSVPKGEESSKDGEEPSAVSMEQVSETGATKGPAAAISKTTSSAHAGTAVAEGGIKRGSMPVDAVESGSWDDNKRPPGGIGPEGAVAFTNQKKKGKVQALGALSTRAQAAKNGEPSNGGALSGNPATDTSSEAVTNNRPQGESVQATGPISKVLVVNKSPVGNKPPSTSDAQPVENDEEAEEKLAPAPKTAVAKQGPKRPGSGGKASGPAGKEAGTPSAESAVEKDDALAPVLPVNTKTTPDESKADEPEKTDQLISESDSGLKMLGYEIAAVRWDVRLVRDAIVPTVPVRVGEADTTSVVREKLVSERKSRVPEMFKNSTPQVGFVFALPQVPEGGAFYWRDAKDAVKRTIDANQAEISWAGNAPPYGSVFVLVFPNGREAVRLTVTERGGLLLLLAEGMRGNLRLRVARMIVDESGPASVKRALRFGWQVNGVARKSEELKPEDRNHTINFPLEKSRTTRMEVALTDRLTGWALVTHIQLRPGKSGGAGLKETKDWVR